MAPGDTPPPSHDDPPREPSAAGPPGAPPADAGAGHRQVEREWRVAMVLGVALVLVGQVLLLLGWWPLALAVVAVPGTIAAVVLLRRWRRLEGR